MTTLQAEICVLRGRVGQLFFCYLLAVPREKAGHVALIYSTSTGQTSGELMMRPRMNWSVTIRPAWCVIRTSPSLLVCPPNDIFPKWCILQTFYTLKNHPWTNCMYPLKCDIVTPSLMYFDTLWKHEAIFLDVVIGDMTPKRESKCIPIFRYLYHI